MKKLGTYLILFLILFTGILIWIKSLSYYQPNFSKGYLSDKQLIFDGIFKYGLYAHIITAPLILFIGSAQIFFRYEFSKRNLHRILGSVYTYGVLLVSAPGALVISFYAFGGWYGKSNFILLSVLWAYFTFKGWSAARSSDLESHRNFMIRSYVLTVSAIWLRLLLFIFVHYFHWTGPTAYIWTAWLSWLPFLLLTELYIRTRKIS